MSFPVLKSAVLKPAALSLALAAVAFPAAAHEQTAGEAVWGKQVRAKLAEVSRYPARAADLGIEGTAKLRVDVNKTGEVTGIALVQSSGSNLLDKAALGMARDLDRLPALDIAGDTHSFVVPLSFRLADEGVKAAKQDPVAKWRDSVRRRVANTVSYPADLVEGGVEGRVKVRLTVDADGTVARQEIAQSSGHEALDAEALLLAGRLGKLPNLPEGQTAGELVLPVVYKIAANR
ncbi:TonB family protein [Kordiimonas aestuarii]|uniref:TonB family protein n=1 Tax=Kordiimonas aestuarii TaxID=1005925 RepID=UPI0021D1443C|nr:TonB family protein [Kordiimonas aestuarii]